MTVCTRAGWITRFRFTGLLAGLMLLGGCSMFGASKPKPAELGPSPGLMQVRLAWNARVGEVTFALTPATSGGQIAVASNDGTVAVLDAATGRDIWRLNIGTPIAAGVGSDGKVSAVITTANELVALEAGRELWRQKLAARSFTAPLVAGGRVFVLAADRSISAFDGAAGRRLWTQTRPGEPLVLRQAGVLLAVGDTLVAGAAGRLIGLNPSSGATRWDVAIASPRGTNDVERLVDLVGRVARVGDEVCARAFQANVGCVNTARGTISWTKAASGSEGIDGDSQLVVGTESDGKVVAWRATNGDRAWTVEHLLRRGLTAPVMLGRTIAIGDSTGLVHLLSRTDGAPVTRLATDGTAIATAPVRAGATMVVVTRAGGVFGFAPE